MPIDYSSDGFLTHIAKKDQDGKGHDICFREAAEEIHDPDAELRCYLRNVSLPDLFPKLIPDIEIPPLIGDPETVAMNHFWYGVPKHIPSDNGPEFVARAIRSWLSRLGVETLLIERGSPWVNGYIEPFAASRIRTCCPFWIFSIFVLLLQVLKGLGSSVSELG
ncbi:MAG: hypothetical protein CME19_02160 [Gemmatimonadetes bacterium]|nr:hypothetical protein [Gemmatimonadota bacterium]